MSVDAEIARRLISIANRLREKGVKVGTMEVETALRLYRAAVLLSGYNYYPLSLIINAVFVKRDYEKAILEEVLRRGYGEAHDEGLRPKPEGRASEGGGKVRARPKEPRAAKGEKCVEMLKRYLETENPGYLDMIKDELGLDEKRYLKEYRAGGSSPLERLVARFALNPRDYNALVKLALIQGGELAILAMRHLSSRKRRRMAEQIASTLTKSPGSRGPLMRGGRWERSFTRERIDLRKTLILRSRGKIGELAYKRRRKSVNLVLIIDRSDSMRKYAKKIIEVASSHLNKSSHLILFSDEVKVIRVSGWKSRLYLLEQILDLSFHGYTNITQALTRAKRIARPGSAVVLISDLQQTIRDRSPLKTLEDLSKGGYKVTVYTTREAKALLMKTVRGNLKAYSFE